MTFEFDVGELAKADSFLDRQELIPDSSRAGDFCMYQYTRSATEVGLCIECTLMYDFVIAAESSE